MKLKLRWIIFFITLTYLLFQFVIPWRIKEPNYDIHEPSAKSFAKYVFETIIPSIEPELKFIEINESPLPEVLADQPGFTTNPKIIRKRGKFSSYASDFNSRKRNSYVVPRWWCISFVYVLYFI